ncbi:MAG: SAVED domain-containing protein [Ignavibacteria bacterium]|nr:SAVED domain-containing protein [Ignavibacteria bacterium]
MTAPKNQLAKTPTKFLIDWLQPSPSAVKPPKGVSFTIHNVSNVDVAPELQLLVVYMCRHPRWILEKLASHGLQGFDQLFEQVLKGRLAPDVKLKHLEENVWRGTIGEVLATSFIIEFTDFIVPVLKLRSAHNEKNALLGDDVLGFKFNKNSEPEALLVCEAKFRSSGIDPAIKEALGALHHFEMSGSSLMPFIINELFASFDENNQRLALGIQRFYDGYNYTSVTTYMIFAVTEKTAGSNTALEIINENLITPLDLNLLLIPNLKALLGKLRTGKKSPDYQPSPFGSKIDAIKDIEKLLSHADFRKDSQKLASAVLTVNLKIEGRKLSSYNLDPARIQNAAHFLVNVALQVKVDESKREELLTRAAKLYEQLLTWYTATGDTSKAVRNGVLGALTYHIAGFNANCRVLTAKISQLSGEHNVTHFGNLWLLGLGVMKGYTSQIEEEVAKILFASEDDISHSQATDENAYGALVCDTFRNEGDKLVALAFARFTDFIRNGSVLGHVIESSIAQALVCYRSAGEHESYQFARMLLELARSVVNDSPWTLLRPVLSKPLDETWTVYLRSMRLGRFPMLTFWLSQKECVSGGLLGDENLLITMPTSAGKTRTVELAMFKALSTDSHSKCAYIVPTRALAVEVEDNLSTRLGKMGFRVSVLYGGYDSSIAEDAIISEARVYVLTMEKFDLLIRQNPDLIKTLSLVIVDEAHEIASSGLRSLRAELVMARLLSIVETNQIRIILLSAVVKNPDDFEKWINGKKVVSKWSPTETRLGYFNWFSGTGSIQYYDDIEGKYSEFVGLKFRQRELLDEDKFRTEVAGRLGLFFANTGNTLIFVSSKASVTNARQNGVIDHVLRILADDGLSTQRTTDEQAERQGIAKECAAILGLKHTFVKAMMKGVCYHHGDLPGEVRRIIERGIKSGLLPLVVSTTTLSKGVNLPFKNCIVQSLGYPQKIPATEFENTVGRAGRAGFETEGHIIFCHIADLSYVAKNLDGEKSISFITSGIIEAAKLRLPSVLGDVTSDAEKWALASTKTFRNKGDKQKVWTPRRGAIVNQEEILSIIDSQLLAFVVQEAVEELDAKTFERLFARTLCEIQSLEIDDELKILKKGIRQRFVSLKKRIPDEKVRKIFNSTGLGVLGNEKLSLMADSLSPTLRDLSKLVEPSEEFWIQFFETLSEIPEFAKLQDIEVGLLLKWIAGVNYNLLAEEFSSGSVEAVVSIIEDAVFGVPWGISALIQLLKSKVGTEPIPNWIVLAPSLVMHGVPNRTAVYVINLGVRDRQMAIDLSKEFMKTKKQDSYGNVKEWVASLSAAEIKAILRITEDEVADEIYSKIHLRNDPSSTVARTLKVRGLDAMPQVIKGAQSLRVVKLGDNYFVVNPYFEKACKLDEKASKFLKSTDMQISEIKLSTTKLNDKSVEFDLVVF